MWRVFGKCHDDAEAYPCVMIGRADLLLFTFLILNKHALTKFCTR